MIAVLLKEDPSCELFQFSQESLETLTAAERQILSLIINGCTEREISQARNTTIETARSQTKSILRKLGVRTRTAAAVLAVTAGGYVPELKVLLQEN